MENKKKNVNTENGNLPISDVTSLLNKQTRPMKYGELYLILQRFQLKLEDNENIFQNPIDEFIKQENFRRDLF